MRISRRKMLQATAGATASWLAVAQWPQGAAAAESKIPIALELWSVRQLCEKDLPRVLKAVGQMGYQGVELAHSDYGHDAAAWLKLLDENHLACCGMHTSLPKLEGDQFSRTVEFLKTLRCPYVIIASVPESNRASVDAARATAKLFNELSAKLQKYGLALGYHCHAGDFAAVDGQTPWELIAANTDPDFIMQIDIGNCLQGGGDAIALIKKFPGRSVSVHLKDYGNETNILGEGKVNWSQVFQACESVGGTKWYIVEEESGGPEKALDHVRRCLENLRKMGK